MQNAHGTVKSSVLGFGDGIARGLLSSGAAGSWADLAVGVVLEAKVDIVKGCGDKVLENQGKDFQGRPDTASIPPAGKVLAELAPHRPFAMLRIAKRATRTTSDRDAACQQGPRSPSSMWSGLLPGVCSLAILMAPGTSGMAMARGPPTDSADLERCTIGAFDKV